MALRLNLLALLLCLSTLVISAQSYQPLLVRGRTWDELHFAPDLCWTDYGVRNRVPGSDSLVGMTWTHVQYTWVIAESPDFCPPYSVDTTTWNTAGYSLREDTAARRVFIQSPGMSPSLLYDFSLSVGDTFISTYSTSGLPFVVTSLTDITLLDGTVVKRFDFSPEGWYIEAIGGHQGLFGWLATVEYPMQIKCVSQDGVPLWDMGYCFGILSSDEGMASPSVQVFPNPASDALEVLTDGTSMHFELFNSQGQVVLSQELSQVSTSLEAQCLPEGIYLYCIRSDRGGSSGRIVILH